MDKNEDSFKPTYCVSDPHGPPEWVKIFQNMLRVFAIVDMILVVIFLIFGALGFIPMFVINYPGFWMTCPHIATLISCIITSLLSYESITTDKMSYHGEEYHRLSIINGKCWLLSALLVLFCVILDIITVSLLIDLTIDCVVEQSLPIVCRDGQKFVYIHIILMAIYILGVDLWYIICHVRLYFYYGRGVWAHVKVRMTNK
jgi:hypothetical protein